MHKAKFHEGDNTQNKRDRAYNNNNSEIEERRRKGIDHSTISKDIKVLRDITAICF